MFKRSPVGYHDSRVRRIDAFKCIKTGGSYLYCPGAENHLSVDNATNTPGAPLAAMAKGAAQILQLHQSADAGSATENRSVQSGWGYCAA